MCLTQLLHAGSAVDRADRAECCAALAWSIRTPTSPPQKFPAVKLAKAESKRRGWRARLAYEAPNDCETDEEDVLRAVAYHKCSEALYNCHRSVYLSSLDRYVCCDLPNPVD
jgi:hypothetical protein